ncbi:MAG: hypothetical protein U5J82_14615 [Desulfobacterales bacterium]|nr:hypothetical protein [Desulfobacterales bacterium]
MMGLDHGRGTAKGGNGLDDVGIEGSLGQELGILDLFGLGLEYVHEDLPDDLPLLFRVGNTGKGVEEQIPCIDESDVHVEVLLERHLQFFRLVFPEQAVVHEDAGEV